MALVTHNACILATRLIHSLSRCWLGFSNPMRVVMRVIITSWSAHEQVGGPNSDGVIMKCHPYSYPCVFHVLYTGDKDLQGEKTKDMSHNGRCRHICIWILYVHVYTVESGVL